MIMQIITYIIISKVNSVEQLEDNINMLLIHLFYNIPGFQDQFDTIDFSDNDIRKLDGFPLLKRLKSLLFNNNRIV